MLRQLFLHFLAVLGLLAICSWNGNERSAMLFRFMGPSKLDIACIPATNGILVAKLTGKLGVETVGGFLKELRMVEAEKLVLDMSGLGFIDSAGVGALVQLFVHCRGKSQKFTLAALTPQGMAIMQVAGLTRLLPQYPTVEEACK